MSQPPAVCRVLILGGTREARNLAQRLVNNQTPWEVTTSLAGVVTRPVLPAGELRLGGFGGPEGLANYLRSQKVDMVVDATHPFAATITYNAAVACSKTGTPRVRLQRPAYPELPGVTWHRVHNLTEALDTAATLGQRIFLTTGRRDLEPTAAHPELFYAIRCVDAPDPQLLPPHHTVIQSRGPFAHHDEMEVLTRHKLDVLVSKDSGGQLTYGKFTAAAELGIPVVMVSRPPTPAGPQVATAADAEQWLLRERSSLNE